MTVTSTLSSQTFPGTSLQTNFTFAFNIPAPGDEQVYLTDSGGNITGPLASNLYSITGYGSNTGGVLTYPLVGSPIPAGSSITLARSLQDVQDTVFNNQGPFFPEAVEQALDYVTMLIQQVASQQDRALTVPVVDPAPLPLPAVAQRAGQLLGFDSNGNPIAAQPSSTLISTAMTPVVQAASLALGRVAFGLGSMATEAIGYGLQDDGAASCRVNFQTIDDAVSQAVPESFHMTRRDATGPITYTLSRANTYWNGFGFWVSVISGGPVTIAIDAHDSFVGQSAGVSLTLIPGQFAYITTDGASSGTWYADVTGQANTVLGVNAQSGSGYTIQSTDWGYLVSRGYSGAASDTLPQAVGSFGAGFWFYYQNAGTGIATLTPTTSTISNLTSLIVPPGWGGVIVSDGVNWRVIGPIPQLTGRMLLNTLIATPNVTTVLSDTTSFLLALNNYEIVVHDFAGATATAVAQFQFQSGGTFQTTGYLSNIISDVGGASSYYNPTGYVPIGNAGGNSIAASGCRAHVFQPASTDRTPITIAEGYDIGASLYNFRGCGLYNSLAVLTGFRVQPSAGAFGSATRIEVYGWA